MATGSSQHVYRDYVASQVPFCLALWTGLILATYFLNLLEILVLNKGGKGFLKEFFHLRNYRQELQMSKEKKIRNFGGKDVCSNIQGFFLDDLTLMPQPKYAEPSARICNILVYFLFISVLTTSLLIAEETYASTDCDYMVSRYQSAGYDCFANYMFFKHAKTPFNCSVPLYPYEYYRCYKFVENINLIDVATTLALCAALAGPFYIFQNFVPRFFAWFLTDFVYGCKTCYSFEKTRAEPEGKKCERDKGIKERDIEKNETNNLFYSDSDLHCQDESIDSGSYRESVCIEHDMQVENETSTSNCSCTCFYKVCTRSIVLVIFLAFLVFLQIYITAVLNAVTALFIISMLCSFGANLMENLKSHKTLQGYKTLQES